MNREKNGYAISAIWGLLALPLSESVYDHALDSGSFMRIFAFLLVMSPVWLVLGWRWLTDNKNITTGIWLSILAGTVLLSLNISTDMYMKKIALIPIFAFGVFMLLIWNYQREEVFSWRKKNIRNILPRKEELIAGAGDLISVTEDLSNDIFQELKRIAPNIQLPFPLDTTESLLCSYALIYLNFKEEKFESGSKTIMLFAGYKSLAITNYAYLAQPKIPGLPPLSGKDLDNPEFRNPVKDLFKMKEESVDIAIENISRKDPYPFYPIYESLRPFISKDATPSQLNNEFGPIFSKLNGKAKRELKSFLAKVNTK